MAKKPSTSLIDRKTVVVILITAALTAVGGEVVKSWVPSAASYGWNYFTRPPIAYVSVFFGEQATPVGNANVIAQHPDPDVNEVLAAASTNKDGRAALHKIRVNDFLVTVSFQLGQNFYENQKLITSAKFPVDIDFGKAKNEFWRISSIEVGRAIVATAANPSGGSISRPTDPKWLTVAIGEIGVREFPGQSSNPRIEAYHASTMLGHASDKTPWGCSFVSWVLLQANVDDNIRSARCADWLAFGSQIGDARRGAIAVLAPRVGEAISGFAGFVVESDNDSVTLVVGNIRDEVTVAPFPKSYVRQYRWPNKLPPT